MALCVLTFLVLAYPPTKEGRNVRRTALIRIGIGCAAFAVWEGPVFSLLNVERPDLSIEAISIPAMEIARSSSHGDLDEELVARVGVDQETLAQEYADRTHCADTVRWEFHFALQDKNYADILRLWANARPSFFRQRQRRSRTHGRRLSRFNTPVSSPFAFVLMSEPIYLWTDLVHARALHNRPSPCSTERQLLGGSRPSGCSCSR